MRAAASSTGQGGRLEKATPEQIWIRTLDGRMPFGKVIVAIANKHARQIWAMLAHDEDYDPHAWLKHPMVHRCIALEHGGGRRLIQSTLSRKNVVQ